MVHLPTETSASSASRAGRAKPHHQACSSGSVVSLHNALFAGALLLAALNVFRLNGGPSLSTITATGGPKATRSAETMRLQHQKQSRGNSDSLRRLVIGIPTVPREGDYLTGTIETLLDWLPPDGDESSKCQVRVVVMNMGGAEHTVFHTLVRRFSSPDDEDESSKPDKYALKANEFLRLVDSPGTYTDPTPNAPEPNHTHNPEDIPGRMGRKQNCDMLNLLSYAEGMGAQQMEYLLLMEDDFSACPHAIQRTVEAINKLNSSPMSEGWLALRVSYGMNGVVLSRSDAATFASYLLEHRTRRPVDLLFAEFVMPSEKRPLNSTKGREMFRYRWNLFAHRGKVSSFPGRPYRKPWPGCSVEMDKVWSLQSHEKFYHRCAATWEFTPCGAMRAPPPRSSRVFSATRRVNRTAMALAIDAARNISLGASSSDDCGLEEEGRGSSEERRPHHGHQEPCPSGRRSSSSSGGTRVAAGDIMGIKEMRERLFGESAKEVEGVLVDEIERRRRDFKKRLEEKVSEAMMRGRGRSSPEGIGSSLIRGWGAARGEHHVVNGSNSAGTRGDEAVLIRGRADRPEYVNDSADHGG